MILIDKSVGITSFGVIRELRRKLKRIQPDKAVPKLGHAGTLDPLASGLLLVALGEETKKIAHYVGLSKCYEVGILVGERRDTGDMEGKIIEEKTVNGLSFEAVERVMSGMIGELPLPVPAYSAIKQNGEALYKKARRGEVFEPPVKHMRIERVTLHDVRQEGGRAVIVCTMEVGSGAYVRSIAEEIGSRLECPTVVRSLRRTAIGSFRVEDALSLEDDNTFAKRVLNYAEHTYS